MTRFRGVFSPIETREPEKTPLIDMVFLLLVFFFVNLSVQEWHRHRQPVKPLQEDIKRSFLKVPEPADFDPSDVVLFEILDGGILSMRNRLLAARSQILDCASSLGCTMDPIPVPGTGPGQQRFWVAVQPLENLERTLASWGGNCPNCAALQDARNWFPVPWNGNMVQTLQQKLTATGALLIGQDKKIHIRVPKKFPASDLLSCFYELVHTTPGLERDHIYIRALEEKM